MRSAAEEYFPVLYKRLLREDPQLLDHQRNTALFASHFGRMLGLTSEELDLLKTAAELHDLGKICIPLEVRQKPGLLSPDERRLVRLHPLAGAALASLFRELAPASFFILTHHERPDGRGYPLALKGSEIPFLSRVLGLCDAVCAMLEERPYSPKKTADEVISELEEGAGTQFDPDLVRFFLCFCTEMLFKKVNGAWTFSQL